MGKKLDKRGEVKPNKLLIQMRRIWRNPKEKDNGLAEERLREMMEEDKGKFLNDLQRMEREFQKSKDEHRAELRKIKLEVGVGRRDMGTEAAREIIKKLLEGFKNGGG